MPRIYMPIFWIEQKFVMDADTAGKIRFALLAPWIGQVAGVSLLIVGVAIISIKHFRRCFCANSSQASNRNIFSKIEKANAPVIKDYEMNPLVGTTESVACCNLNK